MYIGIDVDKNFLVFEEIDEKGETIDKGKIENSIQSLDRFARNHRGKIALEASSYSIPIYRHLVKLGFETHMAHPGTLDKITKSSSKTDPHDASDLAQLLRTGYLPESWIADEELQSIRSLIKRRVGIGQRFSQIKNKIHGLLALNGVKEPDCSDLFGRRGIHFLQDLRLSHKFGTVLESLLREMAYLEEERSLLESRLAEICRDERFKLQVEQLMEIRGVGFYSAIGIIALIGDMDRFPSDRKLCSWAGLVPRVRQSGKKEIHGHITKAGPRELRWLLIQDAETAVRYPGKLRRFYLRKVRTRGHKKAIVAVAHKLLKIIYHMLKEDKPYEERDDDLTYGKIRRMERMANKNREKSPRFEELERKGRETYIMEVSITGAG